MSPSVCIEPVVGGRILGAARLERARLPHEFVRHLDACASCQVSFERARRIAWTWQGLEPSDAEVATAWARFVARA
ncbi:MAG: hypothetical protein ACLQVI_21710 [Polyangiaceae bacterium]